VEGTGEVKLARRLDYENKQLYILSIVAANRAPESLTAQTRLSINVLDVNDNSPRFTNDIVSVSIPENTNTSTPVSWLVSLSVFAHPPPLALFQLVIRLFRQCLSIQTQFVSLPTKHKHLPHLTKKIKLH